MHVSVQPEPERFHDEGSAGPPKIVLERVVVGSVKRRTERFKMMHRIAYRDREYGDLLVPADLATFETDLTSVPTIFTWLVPRTGKHLPAALIHDGLVHGRDEPATYLSVEGRVLDRVAADRVFRAAMRDSDTGPVRSWLIWSAITLSTIWHGSASWSKREHLRYVFPAVLTLGTIVVLGVLSTLDLFDVVDAVPWMGDRPFGEELLGGLSAAVAIPLLLGLTWGRFAIAGVVSGIALAVLLHVTVALAAITAAYQAAEWIARRRPFAAIVAAGIVVLAPVVLALLFIGPFR